MTDILLAGFLSASVFSMVLDIRFLSLYEMNTVCLEQINFLMNMQTAYSVIKILF